MLILLRNQGQQIRIGDEIIVQVLAINGKQVKIGIDAPKSINVDREEIYHKKKDSSVKNQPCQVSMTKLSKDRLAA